MGIEPTSSPWQGGIIAFILYLHLLNSYKSNIIISKHSFIVKKFDSKEKHHISGAADCRQTIVYKRATLYFVALFAYFFD